MGGPTNTARRSRCFAAGRFHFLVRSNSQSLLDTVERLYIDLPPGDDSGAHTFTASVSDEGGIRLSGPALETGDIALTVDAALNELVWAVNRGNLDGEAHRLHIHGAAVVLDEASGGGIGLALVAPSGTGKSTTAAALLNECAAYLSDEAFSLAVDDDLVEGFPKPLSIKPPAHHLLPHLSAHAVSVHRSGNEIWHVAASSLGARAIERLTVDVLVFLERTGSTEPTTRPLPRSDAVVHLVENSQDFERFGPSALLAASRFVARTACVVVDIGPLDQTVALLRGFEGRDRLEPVDVGMQPGTSWLEPALTTVHIGDEAIVHHAVTGRLVALGPSAARTWTDFCEATAMGDIATDPLLSQMARLGFINDPDRPIGSS